MEEETFKLNARRLAAAGLILYAIGTLIFVIGLMISIGIIMSITPIGTIPQIPITAEMARLIAGLILMLIGFIFFLIFTLYGGFKGRSVVSKRDLSGWPELVKRLGTLYFLAVLFIVIGIFIIPGTSMVYANSIVLLVSSILLMVSARMAPIIQRSIAAGVLLIISALLSLFTGWIGIPGVAQIVPGVSQVVSAAFLSGIFTVVALILVGVALIIRQVILRWPISQLIAAIGGLIFTIGVAYTAFSAVSFMSGLPTPRGLLGPLESAYWTLYSTLIAGSSLIGISGILGLIALILAIIFVSRRMLPAIPPPPSTPSATIAPPREVLYCPGCGTPVNIEDLYCARCGRRLR